MTVAMELMMRRESDAAALFESRWTLASLKRIDPDLYSDLVEQRELFHQMLVTGEDDDIREHGEAMIRGWGAVIRRMESSAEPDNAYLMGEDPKSGMRVAISPQRASAARVGDLQGHRVIFLTPDEVAAMFAGLQTIATVKALWPGAQISAVRQKLVIDPYPEEAARQEDEPDLDYAAMLADGRIDEVVEEGRLEEVMEEEDERQ